MNLDMKSHSYSKRGICRQLCWWTLVLLTPFGALSARAQSVSGTVTTAAITDAQTISLYSSATVSAGATNWLTVVVSLSPVNLGGLSSVFTNLIQKSISGTNAIYGIDPTNAAQAGSILQSLVFTPTNNYIPVPFGSNAVLKVYAVDAFNNYSPTQTTVIQITAANDAPQLTTSNRVNITDQQTTNPFTDVMVVDPDNLGLQPQTVTVTLSNTNGFLVVGSSGFVSNSLAYKLTNATPDSISNAMSALVYQPINNLFPVGQSFTNVFTITDSDGYAAPVVNTNVRVVVYSTNDAPIVAGSGTANITDQQTTNPFVNVTVTDPDESGRQLQQSVTVTLSNTNGYLLVTNSGFVSNNPTTYVFNTPANPAVVTAALQKLIYQPINNLLPVGTYDTNVLTIVDSDGYVFVTNASLSVVTYSTNDTPILGGLPANHIVAYTGKTLTPSPFATTVLSDVDHNDNPNNPNGQDLAWTVTLTGSSTPVGNLQLNSQSGTSFAFTNDQYSAGISLRQFSYVPPSQYVSGTNFLTITITANDRHGGIISSNLYIDLSTLVLPVILSGTQPGQLVYDNGSINPFANVTIQSRNGNPVNLTVKSTNVLNDAQGQLINAGSLGFSTTTTSTNSTCRLSGTSSAVTAAIRSLVFQPVPNRIGSAGFDLALFEIDLDDGLSTNLPDSSTTVIIQAINDLPQMSGITPLTSILDSQTATPFGGVQITDVDEKGQQTNVCQISFDNTTGVLTNSSGNSSLQFVFAGGQYQLTGTPANLTAGIRQLVFVPTPGLAPVGLTTNTSFQIVVFDNHGGQIQNNGTVVRVQSTAGNPIVNLPSPLPYSLMQTTNVFPFANSVNVYGQAQPFKLLLTVSDVAQGDFTTNSVATNFTSLGGGKYFMTGLATNIVTALQALAFAPKTNLSAGTVINFTLSVTNSLTPPGITTKPYSIVLRNTRISHIVTQYTDDGTTTTLGTLRNAIASAGSGDHITFDLGAAATPQVIALQAPIYLNNDLVFDGPGAERLTISGDSTGTGTPTTQIFVINAKVTMNRLTFTKGYSPNNGGAFEVNPNGNLKLSYCAVTDCRADQYGGGVDVNDGALDVEHCLFRGNSTSSQLGAGGGAVSLYTDQTCRFMDTTFATNRQNAVGDGVYTGLGGGAIYAEPDYFDLRFPPYLNTYVLNCTFHDNVDAAGHGSSIRPNDDNANVLLQNTIVADGQGNNLELDLSGHVTSLGGNISDDATHQTYSSGGTPVNNYVFHAPLDYTNRPATSLFAALANNAGPTATYALLTNSIAVNNAVSNVPAAPFNTNVAGADQRGYFRTNASDIGAFELGASQKIIIEEIGFNPVNANDQFIEFYVPRDSAPLNVGGYQVLVDGVKCYTFSNQLVQPGQALVLTKSPTISPPAGVLRQTSTSNLNLTQDGSVVTVMNANNQIVFEADYLGNFASTDTTDAGHLTAANQSVVLWPQFQGVFLPYERVVTLAGGTDTNGFSNPGYDATYKSLGGGNAPPTANPDAAITDTHTMLAGIPVLANDVDPDIIDTLGVVWVGTNSVVGVTNASAGVNNNAVGKSLLGATLSVNTDGTIAYDPTGSTILQSLPQGVITNDWFKYTILDYSNAYAGPNSRGSTGTEISNNWVKATATVSVTVVGVNSAPTPQNDYGTNNPNLATYANLPIDFTTATNVLLNDTDPNSDDNGTTLNIVAINATNGFVPYLASITTALGATAVLDIRYNRSQAHITYDPSGSAILRALNQNQTTNDVFYYTVQDSHGAVGTAAISILVRGVNNGPVANPDFLTADEDTPQIIPASYLLSNDTDVDNAAILSIAGVSSNSAFGAGVQLTNCVSILGAGVWLTNINGTNYVVYDPTHSTKLNGLAQKEFTNDSFTYRVTDQWGTNSFTTVMVTVAGVNDRPVSQPDYYSTDQNTPLAIPAVSGVLSNDYDPDVHDLLRVIPFSQNTVTNCDTGNNGGAPVTVNADGSFTFDPRVVFDWVKQGDTNYDTFSYVMMDHSLSIAADDNFAVNAGSSNNVLPVLANDVVLSAVGGAFTIIGVSVPTSGSTVSITASNNAIVYTPAAGFVGTETFFYTNADGLGGKDWAKVSVDVKGNTLFAVNDSFTVANGTTNVLNPLANDVILPASAANLTITALGTPSLGGTVTLNGTGPNNTVIYVPSATNSGSYVEQFTYTVTSGTNAATATVTVGVMNRSNALVANTDRFTVLAGSANNPLDVLANDNNLSGLNTNLVITGLSVSGNVLGTVSVNNAGNRLLYTPPNGISNLFESVTYFISDGAGGTAQANATIQTVSSGFVANNDYFTIIKNSTSNSLPVMVNDVILPNLGQHLYISDVGLGANAPQHGSVTISPSRTSLIYTPSTGFNGSDTFTYEITDGSPARAQGAVTVSILDFSAVPSNPDYYRVARDSTNNVLPVLANDYTLPVESVSLTITAVLTNGVHAYVGLTATNANNILTYVPNTGFIGRDVFSYVVRDNLGNLGTNLVMVAVGDLAPRDDAFNVLSDTTNNFLDVRANDYPLPDTNALRPIFSFSAPSHGTVTTNAGGTALLYTPALGYAGVDQFTYQLGDDTTAFTNRYNANVIVTVRRAGSDRDTNTVTVAVAGVNDLPTIVGTQSGFHITDKQTVAPFTNIVIGDRDECGYQTNTVTVSLDLAAKGVLQNLGGFVNVNPGVYRITDTPPNITASLQGLVFRPTENRITVPTSEWTRFTIQANDGYVVSPVTDTNTTVLVTSVDDAPTIVGTTTNSINDKQTVQPFSSVVVADVDNLGNQALIAHITLDHVDNQSLTNLGGFTNLGGGVYVYGATNGSVTAAMITTALQGIVLVPTPNHIIVPTTVTTHLTLAVDDTFTNTVIDGSTAVSITASNDAPTIVGTATYAIDDKHTVNPFASVVVADVDDDALQLLTVHIALDHLDNQSLTNLGGFTLVTNGYFVLTATPTNITTALRGIVLVPTPNHIPVPASVTTHLSLAVDDGFAPTVSNKFTTVTIFSTNDAPVVTGNGNYFISDKQSIYPFATINVVDVDNDGLQPLVLEISMDHLDNGALQNLGGFTQITNGLFEIYGTPTNITKALRGIVYVPVPNHIPVPTTVTTHLTLSVDDGFIAALVTNLTTVSVTASNDAPVISGTVAGQTVYDRSFIRPFATTLITEVDNDATQAIRISVSLDDPAKGNLSSLGGFSDLGGGVYSYGVSNGTVTAAMATTALRGLLFTPTTASRVTPGSPETTRFTIKVDDFFAPTVVDSNTTVLAIDPLTAAVAPNYKTNLTRFGWVVATTRDLAVVGAPNDGLKNNYGAVYLFARSLNGSNIWTQAQILLQPDGSSGDAFGSAVAISGNTIVVGSPFNVYSATNAGAAYVYTNLAGTNLWSFAKKLVSTNPVANDQFGTSVSISGDDVVVGVPLSDSIVGADTGSAYVFERNQSGANQWGVVKRLASTNPVTGDHFGSSVSISGDDVVVGVPFSGSTAGGHTGSAYIFERNQSGAGQWGVVKRLVSTNSVANDQFGSSVSISGDDAVVGVPFSASTAGGHPGSAYVFERNQSGASQWGIVKRLVSSTPVDGDQFGSSVAIDGDAVIVGVPQADANGIDSGASYLFNRNQNGTNVWGQVDRFLPAAVGASDNFGSAVAIASNTVVVGAYNGLNNGVRCGAAYMFRIKFNNGPRVVLPLADQTVTLSSPLAYTLPAGAFSDPDVNETLQISLGNSPAPPAWLNFDPLTGVFSGIPGVVGTNVVAVIATDSEGLSVKSQFNIYVNQVPVDNHTLALGFQTLGTDHVITVNLTGVPGVIYKLQKTPSLTGIIIWSDVAMSTADVNGVIVFYDVSSSNQMYYRAVPQ